MKTDSIESLKYGWQRERRNYALCLDILDRLGHKLSDSVQFSPSYYILITCFSREDLATLMTLAPRWAKSPSDKSIEYTAEVDGLDIHLAAVDAALPGTCKLVEEEYEVAEEPAKPAVPAHRAKRMVLKCDKLEPVEEVKPESGAVPVAAGVTESHPFPEEDPFPGEPL